MKLERVRQPSAAVPTVSTNAIRCAPLVVTTTRMSWVARSALPGLFGPRLSLLRRGIHASNAPPRVAWRAPNTDPWRARIQHLRKARTVMGPISPLRLPPRTSKSRRNAFSSVPRTDSIPFQFHDWTVRREISKEAFIHTYTHPCVCGGDCLVKCGCKDGGGGRGGWTVYICPLTEREGVYVF